MTNESSLFSSALNPFLSCSRLRSRSRRSVSRFRPPSSIAAAANAAPSSSSTPNEGRGARESRRRGRHPPHHTHTHTLCCALLASITGRLRRIYCGLNESCGGGPEGEWDLRQRLIQRSGKKLCRILAFPSILDEAVQPMNIYCTSLQAKGGGLEWENEKPEMERAPRFPFLLSARVASEERGKEQDL